METTSDVPDLSTLRQWREEAANVLHLSIYAYKQQEQKPVTQLLELLTYEKSNH